MEELDPGKKLGFGRGTLNKDSKWQRPFVEKSQISMLSSRAFLSESAGPCHGESSLLASVIRGRGVVRRVKEHLGN